VPRSRRRGTGASRERRLGALDPAETMFPRVGDHLFDLELSWNTTVTFAELKVLESINLCSIQRKRVVDRFRLDQTHIQLLEHAAHSDPTLEQYHRIIRTVTDSWLVKQFEQRMKWRPRGPLLWCWFENEALYQKLDGTRKHDDEHLVHLRVPVSELLISLHAGWSKVLLDVQSAWHTAQLMGTEIEPPDPAKFGWEGAVFGISDDECVSNLQASIDRIEPAWRGSTVSLGPRKVKGS